MFKGMKVDHSREGIFLFFKGGPHVFEPHVSYDASSSESDPGGQFNYNATFSESESVSRSVLSNSLRPQPARFFCPWNSPGKNTRLGSHSLLQGIFPFQGWNLGLLHCRQIL